MSVIKTIYTTASGTDTRRFQLSNTSQISPYNQIQSLLTSTYGQQLYGLKYTDDDGDVCSIGSDLELNEAFRVYTGKVLKLEVTILPPTSTSGINPSTSADLTDDVISLDGSIESDFDDDDRVPSPIPSDVFDPSLIQSQATSPVDSVIHSERDDASSSVSTHQPPSNIIPVDALDVLPPVEVEAPVVEIEAEAPIVAPAATVVKPTEPLPESLPSSSSAVDADADVITPVPQLPSPIIDLIIDMVQQIEITPVQQVEVAPVEDVKTESVVEPVVEPVTDVIPTTESVPVVVPTPTAPVTGVDGMTQSMTETKYDIPDEKHGTEWACYACTFVNGGLTPSCAMCGSPKMTMTWTSNGISTIIPPRPIEEKSSIMTGVMNFAREARDAVKDVIKAITPERSAQAKPAPVPTPDPTPAVATTATVTATVTATAAPPTTTPAVKHTCELCDEIDATIHCLDCDMYLCDKNRCDQDIHKPVKMNGHRKNRIDVSKETTQPQQQTPATAPVVVPATPHAEGPVPVPVPEPSVPIAVAVSTPVISATPVLPRVTSAPATFIHHGIRCDGCGISPLAGTRYKCTVCADYDLCDACESKGMHHPDHTMIKMRAPVPTSTPISVRTIHRPISMPYRPYPHVPTHLGLPPHLGGGCDLGSTGYPHPYPMPMPMPMPHPMPMPMPMPPMTRVPSTRPRRPRAEFIPSNSTDGFVVELGTAESVHKVWSLRNSGTYAWPHGAAFVHISGKLVPHMNDGSESIVTLLPECAPGAIVHIACDIAVPQSAGKYRGHYRLMTIDRERFGPKIWVCIEVVEKKSTPVEEKKEVVASLVEAAAPTSTPVTPIVTTAAIVTPPTEEPAFVSVSTPAPLEEKSSELPPFEYAAELERLNEMGFTDVEVCKYLLLNNKGDFQKVCEWLIQEAK